MRAVSCPIELRRPSTATQPPTLTTAPNTEAVQSAPAPGPHRLRLLHGNLLRRSRRKRRKAPLSQNQEQRAPCNSQVTYPQLSLRSQRVPLRGMQPSKTKYRFFFLIPSPTQMLRLLPLGLHRLAYGPNPIGTPNDFCGDSPRAQEVSPDKVPSVNECGFVTRLFCSCPEPLI